MFLSGIVLQSIMSIITRICQSCGKSERTGSRALLCSSCYWADRSSKKIEAEKQLILECYGNVEGPSFDRHNKRCYTFIHSCGTKQTWRLDNLLKQWKTRTQPCRKCGSAERQQKAMDGYIAKFKLSERARTDLRAYTRKVRGLSDATYRENIDTLNPQRLPRGRGNKGWHLDHIISIVECFKRGWTPEQAASLSNLQLLSAPENLSKGRA